jgi:hypothetical protein
MNKFKNQTNEGRGGTGPHNRPVLLIIRSSSVQGREQVGGLVRKNQD